MLKIRSLLVLAATLATLGSTAVIAADKTETAIEIRQSSMVLIRDNFGTMVAMAKGEIPWSDEVYQARAADLKAITSIDLMRGYIPGSFAAGTRAKPKVMKNLNEFEDMMKALSIESAKLAAVSQGGDKGAIMAQFKETAGTCKQCHKKYKNKEKN